MKSACVSTSQKMTLRTIVEPIPVLRSKLITFLPSDDLKGRILTLQTRVVRTHDKASDKRNLRNPSIGKSSHRARALLTAGLSNKVAGAFGVIACKPQDLFGGCRPVSKYRLESFAFAG